MEMGWHRGDDDIEVCSVGAGGPGPESSHGRGRSIVEECVARSLGSAWRGVSD